MSEPSLECSVCGDSFDPRYETYFRLGEEQRPVPELEDMETDDWFSRSWFLCWPCVFTKLGSLVENPEESNEP